MKKRNYILPFILLFLFAVAINFTSCGKKGYLKPTPVPPVAPPPAQPTPPQDPVVVADTIKSGVSLQPSYYNDGMPNFAWSLMKTQSQIKTLRIGIEPDKVEQAKTWMNEAKENGYQVIATYHKYKVLGSDGEQDLLDAANWFSKNTYFTIIYDKL